MAGGVNVPISSTWNPAGINRAKRDIGVFDKQANGMLGSFGKSFAGFGATLGAALGLSAIGGQLRDMAAAAAEDQKSVVALQQALSNVGLGSTSDDAEDLVKSLMLATGVADDQLRGAFQQAATATGDFAKSQQMLKVALDISAATGKDLSTVMTALTKASLGNLGALTRLGVPLSAGTVKSKDFAAALGELDKRFGGQAAAKADTYAGKLQRVNTALGEAQETVGYELLASLDAVANSLGGTNGVVEGITALGEQMADAIRPIQDITAAITGANDAIKDATGGVDVLGAAWNETINMLGGPTTSLWMQWGSSLRDADERSQAFAKHLGGIRDRLIELAREHGVIPAVAGGIGEIDSSATQAKSAVDRLNGALDTLYGRNQSREEARLALKGMREEGPGKSGSRTVTGPGERKTVQFATEDDARKWAVAYAKQAGVYATTLADPDKQAKVLQNAQDYIASQVGGYGVDNPRKYAASLVGVPGIVQGAVDRNAAVERHLSAPVVNNYNVAKVELQRGASWDQLVKEAQKRSASSGGRFSYPASVTR